MVTLGEKILYLDMLKNGSNYREIFEQHYAPAHPDVKFDSFRRMMQKWKKSCADTSTLSAGTYPSFKAHGATVQVSKTGEVVQAWIKQHHDESLDIEKLIDAIKENTTPVLLTPTKEESQYMLEIPLFDMHFPLTEHKHLLSQLILLINRTHYDEINLVIGQDLLHNDDFRGRTSSGKPIEKVDMEAAWRMAENFWYNIVYHALKSANRVNLIYSKGNHDESLSWAFVQWVRAKFPALNIDDSLKQRKCIYWKHCFIGLTHGQTKKNSDPKSMRSQFSVEFAREFADSTAREIHAGHLHHEEANDLYGVTVRRLSTAVPTDEWSDNEGYIGAHKRFMIFEWTPGELDCIHFI